MKWNPFERQAKGASVSGHEIEAERIAAEFGEQERRVTDIWEKYRAGVQQHQSVHMYQDVERFHWMFEGNQWEGIDAGGMELPMKNFIQPVTKFQIANVAMNETCIVFNPIREDELSAAVCATMNNFAAECWERMKLDSKKWRMVKGAAIEGDYYAYIYNDAKPSESVAGDDSPRLKMRFVHKTDVYFSDEQDSEMEDQEWIIIASRVPVETVRSTARENGVQDEDIEKITADAADETQINTDESEEVATRHGKCTVLLYMHLTQQGLEFSRSTREVIIQPANLVKGLDTYPLTRMVWMEKSGSARGIGAVEPMVGTQVNVNKILAQRAVVVRRIGYPNKVVDVDAISDAEAINRAGATIKVHGMRDPIQNHVGYITPPAMNGDAAQLGAELMADTRELMGASSSATGQVDPEKTSGEAIKAARDVSAMNFSDQQASYKQWLEDLAHVFERLLFAYSENGMTVEMTAPAVSIVTGETETVNVLRVIPQQELMDMDINIRIDISPTDPYSILSNEMSLENALSRKDISFEEYVEALPTNAGVPKGWFERIISQRRSKAALAAKLAPDTAEGVSQLNANPEGVGTAEGEASNEVPAM